MPITRLNHAVLYVRDVERSVVFYRDVLGFRVHVSFPGAAFLRAAASTNDHDLGLFQVGSAAAASQAGRSTVGMYHLAWELDTLAELERHRELLAAAGALVGASDHGTTKSLYAHDPDGLEFEVAWIVPADLLTADPRRGRVRTAAGPRPGAGPVRRGHPRRRRGLRSGLTRRPPPVQRPRPDRRPPASAAALSRCEC